MTSTSTSTTTTSTIRLPLHADAAAFFLHEDDHPSSRQQLLAVSTYELVSRGKREGGIHLFDTTEGKLFSLGGVGRQKEEEDENDACPYPGVFDVKWLPDRRRGGVEEEQQPPTLVAALSDGTVCLVHAVRPPSSSAEEEEGEEGRQRRSLREVARCRPLAPDDDEGDGEGEEEEDEDEDAERFPLPSGDDPLDDPSAMALFVDVDVSEREEHQDQRLAASFSDGRVAVLEVAPGAAGAGTKRLRSKIRWRAHEAECWCVSFSPGERQALYTGADDCEMFAWDLREVSGAMKKRPRPAWRAGQGGSKRGSEVEKHGAGVCCISPSPNAGEGNHLIASGSYDGVVRIWDARKPLEPVFVGSSPRGGDGEEEKGGGASTSTLSPFSSSSSSSAPLGGGAWRLVWHPGGEPYLLCAAMHAGFAVLRVRRKGKRGGGEGRATTSSFDDVEVERRYREHGADPSPLNNGSATLAYGCDWHLVHKNEPEERLRVATASFYDNTVHLWECRSLGERE